MTPTTAATSETGVRWRTALEERERLLYAAAIYFVDPRPEEVFAEMAVLVGEWAAEAIAAQVWRIAFGEGYTTSEWAALLRTNQLLSPTKCIHRF